MSSSGPGEEDVRGVERVEQFESLAELRSARQVGHLPLRKASKAKSPMTALQPIAFLFPGQAHKQLG